MTRQPRAWLTATTEVFVMPITIEEFCKAERITRPSWYRMIRDQRAPKFYRVGRSVRIACDDLIAWREMQKIKAVSATPRERK
jgi:excisionase family DNA binding protein